MKGKRMQPLTGKLSADPAKKASLIFLFREAFQ